MNPNDKVYQLIDDAVYHGDWTKADKLVTREDLVDWILTKTNPDTMDGKAEKRKPVPCPVCGQNTKMYPVTLTHRHFKYMLNAIWLSDNLSEDGYVHHSVIHDRTIKLMLHDKGVKKGKGIDFTAYSQLLRAPWDLLEPRINENDKAKRDGYFRPTDRGRDFCRGKLALPEKIYIHNKEVIRFSNNLVYCFKLKDVNFKQLLEVYKTW